MKKVCICIILLMIIPMFVFSNQALAWGPEAHTVIGQTVLGSEGCRQDIIDNPTSFLLGNILPDIPLSLAYYKGYDDSGRQYLFHSDKFLSTMIDLSTTSEERAFAYGWLAHITSDKIESAYSKRQIAKGAPVSADFPVDTLVHAGQLVNISSPIRDLIQQSIDESGGGWHISNTEWANIETAYNLYFLVLYQVKLKQNYGAIAEEWYSDYASELAKSVNTSLKVIGVEPTPPPPEPPPPPPEPTPPKPPVFDPWVYDMDGSGVIEKDEVVVAVNDYFDGVITKAQVVKVLILYLLYL